MKKTIDFLACATTFNVGKSKKHIWNNQPDLGRQIYIHKKPQADDTIKWRLEMEGNWTLGKDGVFYYEPMPSSRDDEYLSLCRFDTKEQAYEAWVNYEKDPVIQLLRM